MTKSAAELLAAEKIVLKRFKYGWSQTLCPRCSHARKKKRDPCLSVNVRNDGIGWNCFNCGWKGGSFYEQSGIRSSRPEDRNVSRDQRGNRRSFRSTYGPVG